MKSESIEKLTAAIKPIDAAPPIAALTAAPQLWAISADGEHPEDALKFTIERLRRAIGFRTFLPFKATEKLTAVGRLAVGRS